MLTITRFILISVCCYVPFTQAYITQILEEPKKIELSTEITIPFLSFPTEHVKENVPKFTLKTFANLKEVKNSINSFAIIPANENFGIKLHANYKDVSNKPAYRDATKLQQIQDSIGIGLNIFISFDLN